MLIKLLIAFLAMRDLNRRTGVSYEQMAVNGCVILALDVYDYLEDTPEGHKAIRFVKQRHANGAYRGLKGELRHQAMRTDLEFAKLMVSQKIV